MKEIGSNIDEAEISKFEAAAERWWDATGEFGTLHHINPARISYIRRRISLPGVRVLDIGCGGGILAESLAALGAHVTGIDAGTGPLRVAEAHRRKTGLQIEYLQTTVEELAEIRPEAFDLVTCLELLEHVPRPGSVLAACAKLIRQGGDAVFATVNRNIIAFLLVIFGAEYLLGILPRGTHRYDRFVKPSELIRWGEAAGLTPMNLAGMRYNPFTRSSALVKSLHVNYLAHFRKAE
jgi:2-polyprenyl-6-hydroxyphenyl methylase/3-demethylubiquinone-9 3-methyltransferase